MFIYCAVNMLLTTKTTIAMKKITSFFAMFIIASSFISCSVDGQGDIQTKPLQEVDDWRKVENIMSPEFARALADNGLILKGCEYLGDITEADYDELASYWVADDTYWAADVWIRDSVYFTIRQTRDLPKLREDWREGLHSYLKERLINWSYPIFGKAELFWNYKGLDFSTICALSRRENGKIKIAYDHIISNILIPSRYYRETTEEAVLSESPQTRSDDPDVFSKTIDFHEKFRDRYNNLGAEVGYNITVIGGIGRDGVNKAIWSQTCDSGFYGVYIDGWSADCRLHNEGWDSEKSEYYYGWGVSSVPRLFVRVSFSGGGGYEVEDAQSYGSGRIVITPLDLS